MSSSIRLRPYSVSYIENPTQDQLKKLADLHTPAVLKTSAGSINKVSRNKARMAKYTYIIEDDSPSRWSHQSISSNKALELIMEQEAYIRSRGTLIAIDGYIGTGPRRVAASWYYTVEGANIAGMQQVLAFPPDDDCNPEFTVIYTPDFMPESMPGNQAIIVDMETWTTYIMGPDYFGESKKAMLRMLNQKVYEEGGLVLHAGAKSVTKKSGERVMVTIMGLSGTGKTTLSSDEGSLLLGDDEHGWSEDGLFNFEGGCYAKVINLSKKAEPVIYEASQQFGAILENVEVDKKGFVDFDSNKWTENTRASYPLEFISTWPEKVAGHPTNIIMLTCDAYGVLPPVAKLTPNQAVRQFLLGYTAKVAGTEKGVTEPQPTFSHCFGSPFMPMRPKVYANLLKKKIKDHNVNCWLVNTGWTGGPYGTGSRMPIDLTRSIVDLIRYGALKKCKFKKHAYTDLNIPIDCEEIPDNILKPELGWENKEEYVQKASELMAKFTDRLKTMHL